MPAATLDEGLHVVIVQIGRLSRLALGPGTARAHPFADVHHDVPVTSYDGGRVLAYGHQALAVLLPVAGTGLALTGDGVMVDGRTITRDTTRLAADVLGDGWQRGGAGYADVGAHTKDADGGAWAVRVYFEGERPTMITLFYGFPGEPPGWDGWSRQRENDRVEHHDAWLQAQDHSGFDVWSGYDDKGGFASIALEWR